MLERIFDPQNAFFRPLGKLVDIVCLSVLWLVCSLPVVTLGPATAALYDSAARCVRGGANAPYGRFFETFRENWKTGGLAGLIVAALAAVLVLLYGAVYRRASVGERGVWYALYFAFWVAAVVAAGAAGYLLPVLSRFEFRLGGLLSNCGKLAMAHLPSTALVGLILVGCILVTVKFWFLGFFTPCVCALLVSLPLERVFRPYMDENGADSDKNDSEK